MKSQKGITLTSVSIYVMVVIIVVGILATITATFQSNIKDVNYEGSSSSEFDKFNIYFLKEVKKQGNKIEQISGNEITFTLGSKYTFNQEDSAIYLNDDIKIAENIENCSFSNSNVNGKEIITVVIKPLDTEEKTVEYTLGDDSNNVAYENESDYIQKGMPTYREARKDGNYLAENATYKEGDYTAVIPKGFKISEETGEGSIATGLVIQDANGNEFVWIPVKDDLGEEYTSSNGYHEPKVLDNEDPRSNKPVDSQDTLNYYYGDKEDGSSHYYNITEFDYTGEYAEMVRQVNKYHGFYIGRYETTIDGDTIGSKAEKKALTSGDILIESPNNVGSSEAGYYRWWGLYAEQKKANVPENGSNVQTAMIYGVLWDKTMDFIDEKDSNYETETSHGDWYSVESVVLSGQATKSMTQKDVALNIWDLDSNVKEWTQESDSYITRIFRGRWLPLKWSS